MRLTKAASAALAAAFALAGCYWTPHRSDPGGVSLNVSLPRAAAAFSGTTFRVYLFEDTAVSALYGPPTSAPSSPTPSSRGDYIEVTTAAKSIPIAGSDHYEVDASQVGVYTSGSFTISDIPADKRYRIQMMYGSYDGLYYPSYQGVSDGFEVAPGRVVDVALDLYAAYTVFGIP